MTRRSLFALALAPLARAIELQPPPQIIYKTPWTRTEEWDEDRRLLYVKEKVQIWVHPRERACHARWYGFGYCLTREQLVDYPTIQAQLDLQLARTKRTFEQHLLSMPLDWHGQLRRRT